MGGARGTLRERKGAYRVLVERPKGKKHLEDVGVEGRIMLKWICKKQDEGIDWIFLAQGRDR
jgi:hypothetical protein